LEAAPPTAAAPLAVGHCSDVRDLPGEAPASAHQLPVEDDGAAQPGADGHHEHVRGPGGRTEAVLGPTGGVRVVLDHDRQPGEALELLGERVLPPREV